MCLVCCFHIQIILSGVVNGNVVIFDAAGCAVEPTVPARIGFTNARLVGVLPIALN
jgi:hypothetical protein